MSPGESSGLMRDFTLPCLSVKEEVRQMNALPPRDRAAPSKKSSCPPVPLICRVPELSAQIWPYRSTEMQLLMDTKLSCWPTLAGSLQ